MKNIKKTQKNTGKRFKDKFNAIAPFVFMALVVTLGVASAEKVESSGYVAISMILGGALFLILQVRWVATAVRWIVWDFFGLRAIWEKINPPKGRTDKAPTFFLWIIGLYAAFFGIASPGSQTRARYHSLIDNQ